MAGLVALGLEGAALLLEAALQLGDGLQTSEVDCEAAAGQLAGNQLGVVAQQAQVEHGINGQVFREFNKMV